MMQKKKNQTLATLLLFDSITVHKYYNIKSHNEYPHFKRCLYLYTGSIRLNDRVERNVFHFEAQRYILYELKKILFMFNYVQYLKGYTLLGGKKRENIK